MNRVFPSILLLIALLYAPDLSASAKPKKFAVKGRVVDNQGQPVANASVLVWPVKWPPEDTQGVIDGLIEWTSSKADGSFTYESVAREFPETHVLYVTTEWPHNVSTLVTPPFHRNRSYLEKLFACKKISVKGHEVDVGDVTIQLRYSPVAVRLLQADGSAAFTEADDWPPVWLYVKDEAGRKFADTGLPQAAFRRGESSFLIGLPQGRWVLEVRYGERRTSVIVEVGEETNPQNVTAKLRS